MGIKESSLKSSLIGGWWYTMKNKKTLIFGPQLGFNIRSPEGKTVLIFGENHKHQNISECGPNQKLFVDLYEDMLQQPKCESMQVILEISEEYKKLMNKTSIDLQGNRIFTMLKKYFLDYHRNDNCRIILQFANPYNSNVRLLKDLLHIQKYTNKQDIIKDEYFIGSFVDRISDTFNLLKKILLTLKFLINNLKYLKKHYYIHYPRK